MKKIFCMMMLFALMGTTTGMEQTSIDEEAPGVVSGSKDSHSFMVKCFVKHLNINGLSSIQDIQKIHFDNRTYKLSMEYYDQNRLLVSETQTLASSNNQPNKNIPLKNLLGLALNELNDLFVSEEPIAVSALEFIEKVCESYADGKKYCLRHDEDKILQHLPQSIYLLLTDDIDDKLFCTLL